MAIFKPSKELLAVVGAENSDDFADKLAAHLKAQSDLVTELADQVGEANAAAAVANGKLAAIEEAAAAAPGEVGSTASASTAEQANVITLDLVRAEAAKAVAEAVKLTGTAAIQPAPVETQAAEPDPAAAGDWAAAWHKSDKLKAEFSSAETCAAYHEAVKRGLVRN